MPVDSATPGRTFNRSSSTSAIPRPSIGSVRAIIERYGVLHVAMNNAGVVNGGAAWELSLADWHRVIDVNLWGVIHGVRTFVPLILDSGEEGHVVNTASMASVVAIGGLGPYTVAKHGVLGLSDVLRADLTALGAPVGVSVVMPGMIRTGMNPIGTVDASVVAGHVVDAIRCVVTTCSPMTTTRAVSNHAWARSLPRSST